VSVILEEAGTLGYEGLLHYFIAKPLDTLLLLKELADALI